MLHQALGQESAAVNIFNETSLRAEAGEANAQFELAHIYRRGQGIEKSDAQAVHWYKKAADQEHGDAQIYLAWMYEADGNTAENNARVSSLYKKGIAKRASVVQACAQTIIAFAIRSDDLELFMKILPWYSNPQLQLPTGQLLLPVNNIRRFVDSSSIATNHRSIMNCLMSSDQQSRELISNFLLNPPLSALYSPTAIALLAALEAGNVIQVQGLIGKFRFPINGQEPARVDLDRFRTTDGLTALQYVLEKISNSNVSKIIAIILEVYPNLLKELSQGQLSRVFSSILVQDNIKLFHTILPFYLPSSAELKTATGEIKKILDYARKINIISDEHPLSDNFRKNPAIASRLKEDQEHSTEDSDSESSGITELEYHAIPKKVNSDSVLLVRGFNFSRNFDKNMRKSATKVATKRDYHNQSVYSAATIDLAKKKQPADYEHADRLVKGYFEMLKLTPDRRERDTGDKLITPRKGEGKVLDFASLYDRLMQVYVNTYDRLFTGEGMTRNFNFYTNLNPFVSTLPLARSENTHKYILGEAVGIEKTPRIRARKSTQSFKHKHIGYIQVYAVPKDDYEKISKSGDLQGMAARREGDEAMFESSIPKEYIIGYMNFSIPSFKGDWTKEIQNKYGINKAEYDAFKENLCIASQEQQRAYIRGLINRSFSTQWQRFSVIYKSRDLVLKGMDLKQPEANGAAKNNLPEGLPGASQAKKNLDSHFKNAELPEGLVVGRAITNGDCLFHSIAQLMNDGRDTKAMRQLAINYMRTHGEHFATFFDGEQDGLTARITEMEGTLAYADEQEISALALALDRQIIVISNDHPIPPIGDTTRPVLFLHHEFIDEEGIQVGHYQPVTIDGKADLNDIMIKIIQQRDRSTALQKIKKFIEKNSGSCPGTTARSNFAFDAVGGNLLNNNENAVNKVEANLAQVQSEDIDRLGCK